MMGELANLQCPVIHAFIHTMQEISFGALKLRLTGA